MTFSSQGLEHNRGDLRCNACRIFRHRQILKGSDTVDGYPMAHLDCPYGGLLHSDVLDMLEDDRLDAVCDGCGLTIRHKADRSLLLALESITARYAYRDCFW
jgi:hypothetical protein